MTDSLEEIFRLQKQYHDTFIRDNDRYPNTRDGRVDKLAQAIIQEAAELQRLTNWKWWKEPKPLNLPEAREELIDILHFLVDAAMELDMDAEQLFIEYRKKMQINIKRQEEGY